MPFKFYCRNCNQKLEAPDNLYGTEIVCPKCTAALHIPDPTAMMQIRPEKLSDINMACPLCGYPRLKLPDAAYGDASCSCCGNTVPLRKPDVSGADGELPPLPDYYLVRKLGEGGSGVVYEGRQLKLDSRCVAIKLLSSALNSTRMLAGEVSALVRLSHPCVVRIYDTIDHDRCHGIVMELVTGPHCEPLSMRNILDANGGRISPIAAAHTALTISAALEYAHRQNVLHLDLKPENILIDHLGMIRLVDFGISRFRESGGDSARAGSGRQVTAAQDIFGTPGYLPPERNLAGTEPSPLMDVYSLGAVFYEMLTGKVPGGRFQLPSESDPAMPKVLDGIIECSLNIHQGKRYQSMALMCEALSEALKIIRTGVGGGSGLPVFSGMEQTVHISHQDVSLLDPRGAGAVNSPAAPDREDRGLRRLAVVAGLFFAGALLLFSVAALFSGGKRDKQDIASGEPVPVVVPSVPVVEAELSRASESRPDETLPAERETSVSAAELYQDAEDIFWGRKGERNLAAVVEILRKAAAEDFPPAFNRLGEIFLYGEAGGGEPRQAYELFRRGAELGDREAAFNLGECFYYGLAGGARDYLQAVRYYQRSLDLGSPQASYALGRCYELGHGVARNPARAVQLYRQAADANYAPAREALNRQKEILSR